ncbi:uncharacterized protein LOC102607376 isoform X2 [Citrus sinensis]|nr:uncharacterized protein LOC102607376 isoform X2 [Citrus sinensis]
MEKFQKYEADYTHRLMAKYFSKNNIYGGNVFDDKTTIDDETIMSSRWPCIQTFADPMQGYEDQNISGSTSTVETPNNISNGKHTPKKNNSWGMVSRLDDDPLIKSVGPKMVKDVESMDLGELGGSLQRVAFKLATLASCYKHKTVRHERKLQAEIQDLKKKAESADRSKEKMLDLHRQVMDLEEKVVIAESKTSKLESELVDLKSVFEATQSERDTQKTAYEEQIKSLNEQIAELKGKAANVDDRLDAKYDSGLTFCYKCIMFVLKKEYLELNMNKLETGVQEYMAKQGQGDKNQGEVPPSREQGKDTGDQASDAGREVVFAPSEVVNLSLPETVDPPSVEVVDPSAHNP